MNIKNYIAGELRQEYQYKSFMPSMINHIFTWEEPQINTLLEYDTLKSRLTLKSVSI